MDQIIIKNQAEYDALKDFDKTTYINIAGNLARITKTPKNAIIYVYSQAIIASVSDHAVIKSVYDHAVIEYVYDQTIIKYVSDHAVIKSVSDHAVIKSVSDQAIIEYVFGQAIIKSVSGHAVIKSVSDQAVIESVFGQAIIASVYDHAIIKSVFGDTLAQIYSESVKVLSLQQSSVLIYRGCKGKPSKTGKSATVIYKPISIYNLNDFINQFEVTKEKSSLILYKAVDTNLFDFYTHTIKYEIGKTITCPDWDDNKDRECGGGLHLSPSIFWCKKFNKGRYLKCKVNIKDIIVHEHPDYPYKVRCKKVKILEEVFDNSPANKG